MLVLLGYAFLNAMLFKPFDESNGVLFPNSFGNTGEFGDIG